MKLFTTILLNSIIVLLLIAFGYIGLTVYRAYNEDGVPLTQFVDPAYLLSMVDFRREEAWVVYESSTFTFEHPESWHPRFKEGNSALGEAVDLRIPVIFSMPRVGDDRTIGYYRQTVITRRPKNLDEESEIIFAGRRGFKWISKNADKFVVYEYIIPLNQASQQGALSFSIRVEAVRRDPKMEQILDRLVQSVKFKDQASGF